MPRGKLSENNSNKNFYAITNGRVNGIFKAWSQVKPLVDTYSGAAFKGFENIDEAIDFMKKGGFIDTEIQIYETDIEFPNFSADGSDQNITDTLTEEDTVLKGACEERTVENTTESNETDVTEKIRNVENTTKSPSCVICKLDENKEMLPCSTCNGRVHHSCTGLPDYQIAVFKSTQRKFMCEICVGNSNGIKIKCVRKSVSESGCEENQEGTVIQHGPATGTINVNQRDDMAELKREVGQIKLTLSNFEQEMTRIIIQMRDENVLLKEKNHEDKLRNAENQREEAAKRTEKLENANEQLHVEIINLKEKNSNLNKECENLRKCISTRTEAQNQLTKEIESKTTEINDLRRQQDQIQKHATEKKEAATREGETYAQKVKSDRRECPTIETGNRSLNF